MYKWLIYELYTFNSWWKHSTHSVDCIQVDGKVFDTLSIKTSSRRRIMMVITIMIAYVFIL